MLQQCHLKDLRATITQVQAIKKQKKISSQWVFLVLVGYCKYILLNNITWFFKTDSDYSVTDLSWLCLQWL